MNLDNKVRTAHFTPTAFNMQWHITERCNLRCTHCYQTSYGKKELSYSELLEVVDQFQNAISEFSHEIGTFWDRVSGKKIPHHLTITGGEPLVRTDFYDFLSELKNRDLEFSILTNGTLINEEVARKLKDLGPKYVQLSIDGDKETHDSIRGIGNYDKAVQGLKHLVAQNLYTLISFTAHKNNYTQFHSVAQLGREIGVSKVWSDRLIPCGSGEDMKELMLTPDETRSFFQSMKEEQLKRSPEYYPRTEIAMHRALQFLCGGNYYSCQAGKNLITIDTNGDVYPCRRMPIKVGNVLENNILDIYRNSPILQNLRGESNCSSCAYYKRCQGGLRCLSYAVTGNPLEKDPGCWIKSV